MLAALGMLLLLTTPGARAADRDAALRRQLLGTWQNVDSAVSWEVRGETTYARDGSLSGWELVSAVDPQGRRVRLRLPLRARWSIAHGVLQISTLQTSATNVDLASRPRRYRILSITAAELRLRDDEQRTLLVRVRKIAD